MNFTIGTSLRSLQQMISPPNSPCHFSLSNIAIGAGANEIWWQDFSSLCSLGALDLSALQELSLLKLGLSLIDLVGWFDSQICRAHCTSLGIFSQQSVMAAVFWTR